MNLMITQIGLAIVDKKVMQASSTEKAATICIRPTAKTSFGIMNLSGWFVTNFMISCPCQISLSTFRCIRMEHRKRALITKASGGWIIFILVSLNERKTMVKSSIWMTNTKTAD